MELVMHDLPVIEEKTKDELDEIIKIIKASSLPELIKSFTVNCINSAAWFPHILQEKNISLARLRKMLFGESYYLNLYPIFPLHFQFWRYDFQNACLIF